MKTLLSILGIALLASCGAGKVQTSATNTPCADTTATISFINTKNVELQVHISIDNQERHGDTLIHNYAQIKKLVLKPAEKASARLATKNNYAYDVCGPVSGNVTGQGLVSTKKFVLLPCQTLTEKL